MELSLGIVSRLSGIILGRDWLRTKGKPLWKRGQPAPEPPRESFRAVASCFSGEPIETLVVWNEWGARTEVTFYERDRAALTLMLPFAEVDRLIAALQGARAIVNHQSGKVMLPRSSRGKLQMVVTEVNEESLRGLPSEPWANPVELGLYPHFG